MSALLFASTIRRIEADGLARTAPGELMARAAAAVADAAEALLRDGPVGRPVFAFCGPGNNGGDALLAALLLHERGFDARAFDLAGCAPGPSVPADTARVRARAAQAGLTPAMMDTADALRALFAVRWNGGSADRPLPLVLDGLFGIGLGRPLDGLAAQLCTLLGALGAPVIAIDVPSGVDADTGALVGDIAMPATMTVTMIADKPGLHTGRALDHVGRIRVAALGLGDEAAAQADGTLFGRDEAARLLPDRPRDSSKGSFGSVLVVGGGTGMNGAALLAARAAQHGGAGKVWIASPDGPVFDPGQPQLMTRDAAAPFDGVDVLVAGCGLGTGARAKALLERVLSRPQAAVLDADALNLLAADRGLALRPPVAVATVSGGVPREESDAEPNAKPDEAPRVLTPHPLEAARLGDCSAAGIQKDRITAALTLARARAAVVALKGAGTVVAGPDGRWAIVDAGGPALATAGTGDVLAGLIGSLLAQGLGAWEATLLGCWLHADAGDRWKTATGHSAGLSAAELPRLLRESRAALSGAPVRGPVPL